MSIQELERGLLDATDGYGALWPVCALPIFAALPLVYHLMRADASGTPKSGT